MLLQTNQVNLHLLVEFTKVYGARKVKINVFYKYYGQDDKRGAQPLEYTINHIYLEDHKVKRYELPEEERQMAAEPDVDSNTRKV